MPTFRKKPVEIDAWKVPCFEAADPVGAWNQDIPPWLVAAEKSGAVKVVDLPHQSDWAHIEIKTLEGTMIAKPGDWIIHGVKGELYPCKADIFVATYEEVDSRDEVPR